MLVAKRLDQLENVAVDIVAKVAPWAAPLPTAYLVGRATVVHLGWPPVIAVIAAVVIECLGLATTATALTLWDYNAGKRKSDPSAPFGLALGLVAVYFIVATGLTVILDISPDLATYAPAIFPTLSLTGVTVLALRSDHKRRLAVIESVKLERKAQRQARRSQNRQPAVQGGAQKVSSLVETGHKLDAANTARVNNKAAILDTLVDTLVDNPDIGVTSLARQVGRSRTTVYNYLDELETVGRLRKNGNGWEAA